MRLKPKPPDPLPTMVVKQPSRRTAVLLGMLMMLIVGVAGAIEQLMF